MKDDQAKTRRDKLDALRAQRIEPYGGFFPKTEPLQALVARYADGLPVTTAGRLSAKRVMGGLTFADLRDATGKIQIALKQERIGEAAYTLFTDLDLGDIVGVSGPFFKTKTGEVTVQVEQVTVLSKALRPLPEKWHGLNDIEIKYRQRELDLIANEKSREVFLKRSQLVSSLRKTLEKSGFIEVETPMMHPIPGGAAGEPFKTVHKALGMELYLRLAPELYLKRLLVGGFDKVYELNRSFRNEGLSTRHNPEFTMLEVYAAYQNSNNMMELVQELISKAAKTVRGSLRFPFGNQEIDLRSPWETVSFADSLERIGLTPSNWREYVKNHLKKEKGISEDISKSALLKFVEDFFKLKDSNKPVFVTDYWTELSPLAKSRPDRPEIAERFELFIGGMEIANAYSELNDPIEQQKRFEDQLDKFFSEKSSLERFPDKGTKMDKSIDADFVRALEFGMPPAGGLGVGVDRLAMLLLDQASIKDVILFPLLRPES